MIFELILDNWGDQEAFQSRSWMWMVTKGLLTLELELGRPRGFSTSILKNGNQGAFQPRNQSCGDQGAFNLDLSFDNQELFNLNLDER